jgi:hypothetical protein
MKSQEKHLLDGKARAQSHQDHDTKTTRFMSRLVGEFLEKGRHRASHGSLLFEGVFFENLLCVLPEILS